MTSWLSLVTQLTYTNIAGSGLTLRLRQRLGRDVVESESRTHTHTQAHACCMLQMRETRRRHADFSKLSITHAMSERSRQSSIRSRQVKEQGKRQRQRQQRVKETEREMKRRELGK